MEQEYRARVEAEGEKQDTSWADKIILRNELQKHKVAVEVYFFFWYIFPTLNIYNVAHQSELIPTIAIPFFVSQT